MDQRRIAENFWNRRRIGNVIIVTRRATTPLSALTKRTEMESRITVTNGKEIIATTRIKIKQMLHYLSDIPVLVMSENKNSFAEHLTTDSH